MVLLQHRYNVRKCRHHKIAFPEQAAQNEKIIEGLKGEKKAKPKMRVSNEIRDLSKSELEKLKGKIESELGKYTLFDYVLVRADIQSINMRHRYKDEYTEDEEAQINKMIQDAKALTP